MWTCEYTVASLLIANAFGTMFLVAFCLLLHHLCHTHNMYSRVYLILISLHSILRCIYFFLWSVNNWANPKCEPPALGNNRDSGSLPMDIMGTIPAAIFISAFSVVLHSFGRLVFVSLRSHLKLLRCFSSLQDILNLLIYACYTLFYIMHSTEYVPPISQGINWVLIVIELLNGGFLVAYSTIVVRHFKGKLNTETLVLSSVACFFCIAFKCILLLVNMLQLHSHYSMVSLVLYFCIGELVPEFMMLLMQCTGQRYIHVIPSTTARDTRSAFEWRFPSLKKTLTTISEEPSKFSDTTLTRQSSHSHGSMSSFHPDSIWQDIQALPRKDRQELLTPLSS